jgi:hypothetical protein
MVLKGVRRHLRLAQIRFAEIIEVYDENPVGFKIRKIHLQRSGIHGDQRVDAIAGGVDVA